MAGWRPAPIEGGVTPDLALTNGALRLLGEVTLTALDEGSEIAETANLLYADTVRHLLAAHPWRFTLRKARLARLLEPPIGEWPHAHALPAGRLALRQLFPAATPGAAPVREYELFEDRVLSSHPDLWADFQAAPDPAAWPPWFTELARTALAAAFAIPIAASSTYAQLFHQRAFGTPSEAGQGGLLRAARTADSLQQPNQAIGDFPLVAARFGGG